MYVIKLKQTLQRDWFVHRLVVFVMLFGKQHEHVKGLHCQQQWQQAKAHFQKHLSVIFVKQRRTGLKNINLIEINISMPVYDKIIYSCCADFRCYVAYTTRKCKLDLASVLKFYLVYGKKKWDGDRILCNVLLSPIKGLSC